MSLAELKRTRSDVSCTVAEDTAQCVLYTTVAQVPASIRMRLVTTAARSPMVLPKAPVEPAYEEIPEPAASERRNGVRVAAGAAEAAARNAEKQRQYSLRMKEHAAAAKRARVQYEAQYKLAIVRATIDSRSFGDLREAYISKFGPPVQSESAVFRNAFNAEFEGTEDRWFDSAARVALVERCGKLDKSCLLIESIALENAVRRVDEAERRERTNDL